MSSLNTSFSSLGLNAESILNDNALNLDDIEILLSGVEEQTKRFSQMVQNRITNNVTKLSEHFLSEEQLSDNFKGLEDEISIIKKFLCSKHSQSGVEVKFQDKFDTISRGINQLSQLFTRHQQFLSLFQSLKICNILLDTGSINEASAMYIECVQDFESLEISTKENMASNNQDNSSDSVAETDIGDIFLFELTSTRAKLLYRMDVLKDSLVKITNEENVKITLSTEKNILKTQRERDLTKEYNSNKDDENSIVKDTLSWYDLLVGYRRLGVFEQFVTEKLGKSFYKAMVLPLLQKNRAQVTILSKEDTSELKLTVTKTTVPNEDFLEYFRELLENICTCLEWFSTVLFEEDENILDLLEVTFWGKTKHLTTGLFTAQADNTISYLLLDILYKMLDEQTCEEIIANDVEFLESIKNFESFITDSNLCKTDDESKVLSNFVNNIRANLLEKKKNLLLGQLRTIISGDYYETVQVDENSSRVTITRLITLRNILQDEKIKNSFDSVNYVPYSQEYITNVRQHLKREVDKQTPTLSKHEANVFVLPQMKISKVTLEAVDFLFTTMNSIILEYHNNARSETHVGSLCLSLREMIRMYPVLLRHQNKKIFEISKYSMIFFNDCLYLKHCLAVFTYLYGKLLCAFYCFRKRPPEKCCGHILRI